MGYSFDGSAKIVSLTLGTTTINVDDLWSRWCDWLAIGDNSKYLPALRFVGGDAISDVKNLGVTFFIINGWKIRPQEANHRLIVNGNLYTDPAGDSPFTATVGSFNVTIEMQVSSLVDSSLAQLPEIEQASFGNQVAIDPENRSGRAVSGIVYPAGTRSQPCLTLADAKSIALTRGFTEYYLMSNITIGASDNVAGLTFIGVGATLNTSTTAHTTVTLTQNCVTTNSHWKYCRITGYQGGESIYEDCMIDGLQNAHCIYERCGLLDGTTLGYTIKQQNFTSVTHASYFKECFGDEGTIVFDRNSTGLNVTFDGFMGRLKLINQNGTITKTITGATWTGGVATYTSSSHGAIAGQRVTISGITPSGYNVSGTIVSATTNNFTVAITADPGIYVSGGSSGMLYGKNSNVWIHLNGGTVTVDSTCTTGKVTITGFGNLVNNALGTEVDATAFTSEGFEQTKIVIESLRETHQAFGQKFFVSPTSGNDLSPGTSTQSPVQTMLKALSLCVSGRGDSIYLLAPSTGTATITERVVIDKEDVHIRGPGRGFQFQPTTTNLGPVITISANNCSLRGFIVRAPSGSTTDDCILVSGKFSELNKLYVVGAGQGVGTASGIVYTGGDYHELHDVESEKCGYHGILARDDVNGNGSPREISVKGGNFYLNGKSGIKFEGTGTLGSSTRLNRILGANIHDNLEYGVHIDALTSGTLISAETKLHNNTLGSVYDLGDKTTYESSIQDLNVAGAVWDGLAADYNDALTMGAKVNAAGAGGDPWGADLSGYTAGTAGHYIYTKVLTVAKFLGLK